MKTKALKPGTPVTAVVTGNLACKAYARRLDARIGSSRREYSAELTTHARAALRSRGITAWMHVWLVPETEGTEWCRGWGEKQAQALLAARAL